jgi:hypothetical protein
MKGFNSEDERVEEGKRKEGQGHRQVEASDNLLTTGARVY